MRLRQGEPNKASAGGFSSGPLDGLLGGGPSPAACAHDTWSGKLKFYELPQLGETTVRGPGAARPAGPWTTRRVAHRQIEKLSQLRSKAFCYPQRLLSDRGASRPQVINLRVGRKKRPAPCERRALPTESGSIQTQNGISSSMSSKPVAGFGAGAGARGAAARGAGARGASKSPLSRPLPPPPRSDERSRL